VKEPQTSAFQLACNGNSGHISLAARQARLGIPMLIELIALASFLIILTLTWKSFCIEDRIHEIEAGLDDLQVDIRNCMEGSYGS
jgi:hypothetical protein